MSCIGAPSDMRVALFTDSFLPFICGATFAALNQVNALANSGHEVRIYCPGSKGSDAKSAELHDSITLRKVPLSLPWGGQPDLNVVFPALWPTMKDLRAFKPDVVHVHTEWGTGWAGVYAAWRLKIPVVGTFHTFWDDPRYVHHFPWPNWKIIQRAMGNYSAFFYRRCTATIAPSTSVQRHLSQRNLDAVVVYLSLSRSRLIREIAADLFRSFQNRARRSPGCAIRDDRRRSRDDCDQGNRALPRDRIISHFHGSRPP